MKIMIPSEKAKILDENIEFNKENNSLVIGNNLEVDGNLQLNGEIIVDGKTKGLVNYYDVDVMFDIPNETTIRDLMLKALGITSFNQYSSTDVNGMFKINNIIFFGNLRVNNYGREEYNFSLYNTQSDLKIDNYLLGTEWKNVKLSEIIYNKNSFAPHKQIENVSWKHNGIYPKKDIKSLLMSVNKLLLSSNDLVLELVKYSEDEIKLITKENIYDDTTCYLTEYIFKTIVGDEENYSLTIHDDLSIPVEHP